MFEFKAEPRRLYFLALVSLIGLGRYNKVAYVCALGKLWDRDEERDN
jgi:hypothetical protein